MEVVKRPSTSKFDATIKAMELPRVWQRPLLGTLARYLVRLRPYLLTSSQSLPWVWRHAIREDMLVISIFMIKLAFAVQRVGYRGRAREQ